MMYGSILLFVPKGGSTLQKSSIKDQVLAGLKEAPCVSSLANTGPGSSWANASFCVWSV